MLGRNYRFSVNNQGGVNVDVVINRRAWKFGSDGSITFEASETEVFNETAIASSTTAWTEEASGIDNSSDKYIGADLEISITPAASATGIVQIQIQRSTDGGTTWPNDGLGEPIASYYFNASSSAVVVSASI